MPLVSGSLSKASWDVQSSVNVRWFVDKPRQKHLESPTETPCQLAGNIALQDDEGVMRGKIGRTTQKEKTKHEQPGLGSSS